MPQSLDNVVLHLVFSTKNRTCWLNPEIRPEVFSYVSGILRDMGCRPLQVGGHEDHVHLVFGLSRTKSIAQVVEEVKTSSSRWMKGKGSPAFSWQSGYGVFSLSRGDVPAAIAYVRDQDQHHQAASFQDEYRSLLREAGIELDEQYVWD